MTENPLVLLEMKDDTARITLNRPEVLNALSVALSDRLVEAIQTIKTKTDIKFVVIKGSGTNFCAGDDLTEMPDQWTKDEHGDSNQRANGVIRKI